MEKGNYVQRAGDYYRYTTQLLIHQLRVNSKRVTAQPGTPYQGASRWAELEREMT